MEVVFENIFCIGSFALQVGDESKTHIILNQFFMNILKLNVVFKCQIMEYLPKFVFCRNLEKRNGKAKKAANRAKNESSSRFG